MNPNKNKNRNQKKFFLSHKKSSAMIISLAGSWYYTCRSNIFCCGIHPEQKRDEIYSKTYHPPKNETS